MLILFFIYFKFLICCGTKYKIPDIYLICSINSSLFTTEFFIKIVPGVRTALAPILEKSHTKAPNFSTLVLIISSLIFTKISLFFLSLK